MLVAAFKQDSKAQLPAQLFPLVVTNPVTGWKALWGFSPISMRAKGKIDGVTDYEHELMKAYFLKLITDNHDLQYRHRWEPDDVVIWDNRTVLHAGTYDLSNEERMALRVTSLTGRFYCDPGSLSREECFRRDRMRSTTM
ncbi:hypothetical protein NUH16_002899 [Penicillium rubens]|nr:hypothetical protein NUH16_002899 [Penicillium rubens]